MSTASLQKLQIRSLDAHPTAPTEADETFLYRLSTDDKIYRLDTGGSPAEFGAAASTTERVWAGGRWTWTNGSYNSWPNHYGFNGQDWNANAQQVLTAFDWMGIRAPFDGTLTEFVAWQNGCSSSDGAEISIVKQTWTDGSGLTPTTQIGSTLNYVGPATGNGLITVDVSTTNSVTEGEMIFPIAHGNVGTSGLVVAVSCLFKFEKA